MAWHRKRRRTLEIAPDEIFLDAATEASLDRSRLEGRLERPLSRATYPSIFVVLAVALVGLVARAADLSLVQGATLATQSAQNSLAATTLFAPRGLITDEHGVLLAENIEQEDGGVRRHYALPELGQIIGYVSYPKKDSSGNYYDMNETGIAGLEAVYDTTLARKNRTLLF